MTEKTVGYFYKKMQYSGSVNQAKRAKKQPVPQSMDILRKEGHDFNRPAGTPRS